MGDRVFTQATFLDEDMVKVCSVINGTKPADPNNTWDYTFDEVIREEPGLVTVNELDANCGFLDEWMEIAKNNNIVFTGHHGRGYDFESLEFCSTGNGTFYYTETDFQGFAVVTVDCATGEPHIGNLQYVKRVCKAMKEAGDFLRETSEEYRREPLGQV